MLPLNLKKRAPKKPKMEPPYNKAQEQARRAKRLQPIEDEEFEPLDEPLTREDLLDLEADRRYHEMRDDGEL